MSAYKHNSSTQPWNKQLLGWPENELTPRPKPQQQNQISLLGGKIGELDTVLTKLGHFVLSSPCPSLFPVLIFSVCQKTEKTSDPNFWQHPF